jgi:acetylornithine deacetylase/succinyl-diaminopimelate desuccinylase-like protein
MGAGVYDDALLTVHTADSPMTKLELQRLFDADLDRYLDGWRRFLAFPSISTNPENDADCDACADWLAGQLRALGFTTRLIPTRAHPAVFAERAGRPGAPTVLFYGHYDVQPVDPLALWTTPPFEPTLRNGRMFARGAQDNKGQVFAALKGIEALLASQALPCTLKVLIEGDEETGQLPLLDALAADKTDLRADIVMVADTGTVASGAPTLTMGLRGIIHMTALLRGPGHDLHSGTHGGRAPNPTHGAARLIASLHDASGRVTVAGFYDGVQEPSAEERRLANAPGFDAAWYEKTTGAPPLGGELGYTPVERTGFRPAIDVNGVHSGYGGAGSKTVIPAEALIKLSARLVPGQDPVRILHLLAEHLRRHTPPGFHLDITESGAGGPAVRVPLDSPAVRLAREVLGELATQPTAFLWEGASVPILSHLPTLAGGAPLLVGFGSEEDRIHAPDESYSLDQFRLGFLYTGMFLSRLTPPTGSSASPEAADSQRRGRRP